MSAIDDIIDANIAGPASAGNKSENATAQDPLKLIAVAKYKKSQEAAASPAGFLKAITVKLVPPGAT